MATVGHTLVGLSLAGCSRAESRGGSMRFVWLGVMVLLAHLLDIVEWGVILAAREYFDHHWVSNSLRLTSIVVGLVCAGLALFARLRKPWPYVLAAAAVFSHVGLDYPVWRAALIDTYGWPLSDAPPSLGQTLAAEVWLYGLLLVEGVLVRASLARGCPRRGRALAGVLAAAVILAAVSRNPWLWVPAYGVAVLHGLVLMRRAFNWRLAWSVIPLVPLLALLTVEFYGEWLYHHGERLEHEGDCAAAIRMFDRALAVPTRSPRTLAYVHKSLCLRSLGDFAAAEKALLQSESIRESRDWTRFQLAWFYLDGRVKGTPYDRPDLSVKYLELILGSDAEDSLKGHTRRLLTRLHQEGRLR